LQAYGQPFSSVATNLTSACRTAIEHNARKLIRGSSIEPSESLNQWAASEGCLVRNNGSSYEAVQGRFYSDTSIEWALLCETPGEWRLLIVDPDQPEPLAELVRMTGTADWYSVGVAPPGYFDWAPLEWSPDRPFGLRKPFFDAVLVDPFSIFFVAAGVWIGVQSECCYWEP
jgi:hypothetical protein